MIEKEFRYYWKRFDWYLMVMLMIYLD
jgi:hypothetical protein